MEMAGVFRLRFDLRMHALERDNAAGGVLASDLRFEDGLAKVRRVVDQGYALQLKVVSVNILLSSPWQ